MFLQWMPFWAIHFDPSRRTTSSLIDATSEIRGVKSEKVVSRMCIFVQIYFLEDAIYMSCIQIYDMVIIILPYIYFIRPYI